MKCLIIAVLLFQVSFHFKAQNSDSVNFATGFKIGDVTSSSAIVLTRLCASPTPIEVYLQRKEGVFSTL